MLFITMSKCKNWKCWIDNPDTSIVQTLKKWEHRFNFPKYWISIIAKSLDEANEKLKKLLNL